jgi:hypothetical protein
LINNSINTEERKLTINGETILTCITLTYDEVITRVTLKTKDSNKEINKVIPYIECS